MSNERHIRPVFAEGVGYPRDARSDSGSDRGPSGASMGARPAPPSDEQLTRPTSGRKGASMSGVNKAILVGNLGRDLELGERAMHLAVGQICPAK